MTSVAPQKRNKTLKGENLTDDARRRGGARAARNLSPEERSERARYAASCVGISSEERQENGSLGGKARAANMSREERREAARQAGLARAEKARAEDLKHRWVGEVLIGGEVAGYFMYRGAADRACTRIFPEKKGLHDCPDEYLNETCRCGRNVTKTGAILYTPFDGGFYWLAMICKQCMCIIHGWSTEPTREQDIVFSCEGHPLHGRNHGQGE